MANKPRPCWDPFNYYWGFRNVVLTDSPLFYRQADKIIRLATCLIRLNDLPDTVNLAVYIYFLNSLGVIP